MTAFKITLDHDGAQTRSATWQDGRAEVSLHFSRDGEAVGDLTLRFPSVDAVREWIFNLECEFVDNRFIVEGEQ